GVVGVVAPVYSQEKAEQSAVTSVSGEVVSVDLVKSAVVIKQLKDPVAMTYENVTVPVSSETKVLKGDAALKLSDLKIGDKVNVKSTIDASGASKVISVAVETKETVPVK
ncbi:MAG: hypothetical protein NTY34_01755, partial [Candidatus Omnitrophica bacterium]|nr:hypothetical protein [Candidatus Omnitrophota bacterium]